MAINKRLIAKVTPDNAQLQRFVDAARELGADEDESRWDERLREVVKAKPEPKAEKSE